MGIIANAKQYLVRKTSSAIGKIADGISTTRNLSPSQIQKIDEKRTEYLSESPDMTGPEAEAFIQKNLGAISVEAYQAYLSQLQTIYDPMLAAVADLDAYNRIRYFNITKWVSDPREKNMDKLVNVYQSLSGEDCNIALLYHRTPQDCRVDLAVLNSDSRQSDPAKADAYCDRLANAIRGNFPGVELWEKSDADDSFGVGSPEFISQENCKHHSVAIVSNLASEKSENFISQSIEKLLDGVVPTSEKESYTVVLLATPINDQLERKNRLFALSSALSPYATWQTSYTNSESDSENATGTFAVNLGFNAGVNIGDSDSHQKLYKENKSDNWLEKTKKKVAGAFSHLTGQSTPEQTTTSQGVNMGANFGVNFARAASVTVTLSKSEGVTQTFTNAGVKRTLEVLDSQVKRLEESSALGMWEFAAYVLSPDYSIADHVAHMYLSLTQGEQSFVSNAAVNLWNGVTDPERASCIIESIEKLQHPVFGLRENGLDEDWLIYPSLVTPTTVLSGKELAKALNFPQHSIPGLPVLESTAFAREVQKYAVDYSDETTAKVSIGNVYHMRKKEMNAVELDINSLASHVFVTGSTGTGKSNSIYQLLSGLMDKNVKFMVIEPAKGEYKHVLGGKCSVYGTNAAQAPMLYINPFSFPDGIHVLEHIDRLVEIFNACWPMYAAMPAVLKDAIEKSYEKIGWNLKYSYCKPLRYPKFSDLLEMLPEVMESSLYSSDTKSDYSGALITRVQSLTNGLNGQIFCSPNELTNAQLFDKNVIVDLSRVGASETLSLLMGILVMKLQEYRLSSGKINADLSHVTVLEEAHNLLRKTSTTQSQEGANLQGKSVEMITNSIAEMRTYGEGFIIADQAPGLLDEAVIRNTNTKIVLRLPEHSDRQLIGNAMALNDAQIKELARLPRGVAAIYQNDWAEAILCNFDKFNEKMLCPFSYNPVELAPIVEKFMLQVYGIVERTSLSQEDVDAMKNWIQSLNEPTVVIDSLTSSLNGNKLTQDELDLISYNLWRGNEFAGFFTDGSDPDSVSLKAVEQVRIFTGFQNDLLIDTINHSIARTVLTLFDEVELNERYSTFLREERVK